MWTSLTAAPSPSPLTWIVSSHTCHAASDPKTLLMAASSWYSLAPRSMFPLIIYAIDCYNMHAMRDMNCIMWSTHTSVTYCKTAILATFSCTEPYSCSLLPNCTLLVTCSVCGRKWRHIDHHCTVIKPPTVRVIKRFITPDIAAAMPNRPALRIFMATLNPPPYSEYSTDETNNK